MRNMYKNAYIRIKLYVKIAFQVHYIQEKCHTKMSISGEICMKMQVDLQTDVEMQRPELGSGKI